MQRTAVDFTHVTQENFLYLDLSGTYSPRLAALNRINYSERDPAACGGIVRWWPGPIFRGPLIRPFGAPSPSWRRVMNIALAMGERVAHGAG